MLFSVFDREDNTSRSSSRSSALDRRQAERSELMRAQSLPKTSAAQARKAMIEKLENTGGSGGWACAFYTLSGSFRSQKCHLLNSVSLSACSNSAITQVNKVQRSTSFGVPNANSIKQMLLDWCRSKTRSYEVTGQNQFRSICSPSSCSKAFWTFFFPSSTVI